LAEAKDGRKNLRATDSAAAINPATRVVAMEPVFIAELRELVAHLIRFSEIKPPVVAVHE
jgi:hypothetical protein